ncbi:BGTF surface domain-containing protein [Natrarchaeobaculum sulfurireducens]|uniref:Putative secreted glycoprotein n=1 Tax=Natrarchaeobaculum sulfurireducens TaxID=2044521 RepID=A0A346PMN5_9EURY|nr:BGTF surface domain-containing protein [Natrarchaeobaculum sulfurireducens]AXR80780.1 putative secreted glycoprotein [Natrarchaeobaculum sulfurireducens]
MNDNTSYREKGRALFLSVIMIVSVVAMSAAFAGGAAAAASNTENVDFDGNLDGTEEIVAGDDPTIDTEEPTDLQDDPEVTLSTDEDGDTFSTDYDVAFIVEDEIAEISDEDLSDLHNGDVTATFDDGLDGLSTATEDLDAGEYTHYFAIVEDSATEGDSPDGEIVTDDADDEFTSEELTLTVLEEPALEFTNIGWTEEVEPEESVTTTADIENVGEAEIDDDSDDLDDFNVDFRVDSNDASSGGEIDEAAESNLDASSLDAGESLSLTHSVDAPVVEAVYEQGLIVDGTVPTLSDVTEDLDVSEDAVEVDEDDLSYVDADGQVVTNNFQGQDVFLVGQDVNEDLDGVDEVDLREVDSFDGGVVDSSSFEEELEVLDDSDLAEDTDLDLTEVESLIGEPVEYGVEIETDDLDEENYFIRSGTDNIPSSPAEENTFEISVQDFDTEFDDDQVTDGGPDASTDLDIDSDRGSYSVNVSADGDLDHDELFQVALPVEYGDEIEEDDELSDVSLPGDIETEWERAAAIALEAEAAGEIDEDIEEFGDVEHADVVEALEAYDAVHVADRLDNPEAAGFTTVDDLLENDDDLTFGEFNVGIWDEDQEDADEKVTFVDIRDTDEEVDFTDIDEDDYTFDFNVSDTEASSSNDISVAESDAAANFDESVYTQSAGDIVEVTVELEDTDETFIQFGDEDSNYIDILYIEDDGGEDDEVTFMINTRLVGTDHSEHPTADLDADDVFYSDDDIVESLIHHEHIDDDADYVDDARFYDDDDLDDGDELTDGSVSGFGEYLEELDLLSEDDDDPTEQIVRPLQSANYDMVADENGWFIAEDDEADVDDEIGYATLDLIDPELGEISTWVGPEEDADDEDDIDELAEQLTERDNVAIDDLMVTQFEASGIYGHLAALSDDDMDDVLEEGIEGEVLEELANDNALEGEGVEFTFEEETAAGNQDPNDLDLESDEDEVFILIDNEAGEMYLVVDTSDEPFDRSIDDGDEFDIELEYETDDDDRFRFFDTSEEEAGPHGADDGSSGDGDAAFPYFAADSSQSVSTTFTFEDRAVEFDNLDEDENVQIETSEESVVTGETNVAPGSDGELRITNAGDTSSFLSTEDADIHSDGTVEAEFNFDDRNEDDEASLEFRVGGDSVDDADGIFVEAVDEEEPEEDDEADDEEADDDEADDEEADDDEADDDVDVDDDADDDVVDEDDDDEPETEDDGVPGFGIAVALFALIAAGMLALRRQN